MIALEDALARILAAVPVLPSERASLDAGLHRFTAAPLLAAISVPSFDNSSVDGYAIRSEDLARVSAEVPAILSLIGASAAGDAPGQPLRAGECRRILTGAPLPPGADAVVMQEDTLPAPDPNRIAIRCRVRPWENIRLLGEDFRAGTALVPAQTRLRAAHLGLLAAAGLDSIPVHRRARLTLFSTGNELRPPGTALNSGQIYDSNQFLLRALARNSGAETIESESVPDELEALTRALARAALVSDVIVTTGGVSVGDADLLKPAIKAAGGTVELWRIAVKPGKPFAWGRMGPALWFGLPGNPVSAFVTWHLLVQPALQHMMGGPSTSYPHANGTLAEPIANRGDRRHFVRVTLDSQDRIHSAGTQASHLQAPLARADGLLDVPPDTTWPTGHPVVVRLLD